MNSPVGSFLDRFPLRRRKASESLQAKLRNLLTVVAVTASFGLPIWIMVSTVGGPSAPGDGHLPSVATSQGIPLDTAITKSGYNALITETSSAKAISDPHAQAVNSVESQSDGNPELKPSVLRSKPLLSDMDKGVITTVPVADGTPAVISH